MSLISFTWYNSYYYFLVYWIFEFCITLTKGRLFSNIIYIDNQMNTETEIVDIVCLIISDLFAGFLVLYTKFIFRKKEIKRKKSEKEIELIYNNPKYIKYPYYLMIIISILDLLARSVYFLFDLFFPSEFNLGKYETNYVIGFDIIFRFLFCRFILKRKSYRHHFWSIIINIAGLLIMSILDVISLINNKLDKNYKYFILFILPKGILFPLEDVFNKILLSCGFLLPQSLMFIRGLIEFPIIIAIILILLFVPQYQSKFFEKDIIIKIIVKLIYILISTIRGYCLMKTIYIFNPQYVSFLILAEGFSNSFNYFISEGESLEIIHLIIRIICLIIMGFGILMFNEIIIVNKCGLQENTKKYLAIKAKIDFDISNRRTSFIPDDENEFYDDNVNNNIQDNNINNNNEKELTNV